MITLDERLTKKVKHRKEIKLKTIIHQSTIDKVVDEKQKGFIDTFMDGKHPVFWTKVFEQIPTVKLDNRFKIGDYFIFHDENFFLRVRNPDRFKTQIIELCYKVTE